MKFEKRQIDEKYTEISQRVYEQEETYKHIIPILNMLDDFDYEDECNHLENLNTSCSESDINFCPIEVNKRSP